MACLIPPPMHSSGGIAFDKMSNLEIYYKKKLMQKTECLSVHGFLASDASVAYGIYFYTQNRKGLRYTNWNLDFLSPLRIA